MKLGFCSFSSGSSGNCYLIKSEKTSLLVDVGISGKRIFEGLKATGTDTEKVKGILITHEHIDHVRSLRIVSKKLQEAGCYATPGTWESMDDLVANERKSAFCPGAEFEIGDIGVRTFGISHDAAEPVGYSFFKGSKQISIVTDTGHITESIHKEILDADLLVLEANHDIHTLEFCRYPYSVKRRILGDFGHLSNDAAGQELLELCKEKDKYRHVILAHLSRENNFPEMAYQTVKNTLEEGNRYIGKDMNVNIIVRDEISPMYTL